MSRNGFDQHATHMGLLPIKVSRTAAVVESGMSIVQTVKRDPKDATDPALPALVTFKEGEQPLILRDIEAAVLENLKPLWDDYGQHWGIDFDSHMEFSTTRDFVKNLSDLIFEAYKHRRTNGNCVEIKPQSYRGGWLDQFIISDQWFDSKKNDERSPDERRAAIREYAYKYGWEEIEEITTLKVDLDHLLRSGVYRDGVLDKSFLSIALLISGKDIKTLENGFSLGISLWGKASENVADHIIELEKRNEARGKILVVTVCQDNLLDTQIEEKPRETKLDMCATRSTLVPPI